MRRQWLAGASHAVPGQDFRTGRKTSSDGSILRMGQHGTTRKQSQDHSKRLHQRGSLTINAAACQPLAIARSHALRFILTLVDRTDWKKRAVSAENAVQAIQSGAHVFIHGASATPTPLIEALAARTELEGVRLYHLHTAGPAPFAERGLKGRFFLISLFTGPPLRQTESFRGLLQN